MIERFQTRAIIDEIRVEDRQFTLAEARLLRRLHKIIDDVVREVVTEQMQLDANEPIITSHVVRALRQELKRRKLEAGDMSIDVIAQDFNPMGSNSPEKLSGADLYVAILRSDGDATVRKGMLVQAKRFDRLRWGYQGHKKTMRGQAGKIYRKAKGPSAYVLIYHKDGATVVAAKRATYPLLPKDITSGGISLGQIITDGIRCSRGNITIGPKPSDNPIEGIALTMDELGAKAGVGFLMTPTTSRMRSGDEK